MASAFRPRQPSWFNIAAVLLILWGLVGCASLYLHFAVGPGANASDYDRKLFETMPLWLNVVYVAAVVCGLLGAVALFLKRRVAVLLSVASLVLVVVQFGWMFLATDIIAVKGVWVTYFPALIFVVQSIQLAVANTAKVRGWLR